MKSFKLHLSIIAFTVISIQIYGQITINGTVTDSELNPISDALVEIIDETDTNNVYSDVTDISGNFSISNITDIEVQPKLVPTDHIVLRNYPNPFNPTTIIYFELPKPENIEIKIYDILGREVRTLYNNYKKAGTYHMNWDGRNNFGGGVAAGIYFCRLKTKDQFKVHKMVLLDGGLNTDLRSSTTLVELSAVEKIGQSNSIFNFTIRVSGSNILESDFKYLSCIGDTTLNLTVPQILQTVAIGPVGGKLETEEFSLTIPAEAFASEIVLNLYKLVDEHPFGDNEVSSLFHLEGLPNNYSKPLQLSLKYNKDLSDSSFIAMGEEAMVSSTGELETSYQMLSTTNMDGYLHCTIPYIDMAEVSQKNIIKNNIEKEDDYRKFVITSKYLTWAGLISSKFKLYVPRGISVVISDIANLIDETYNTLEKMHYGANIINEETNLIIRNLVSNEYCKFKYTNRTRYRCIEINNLKMTSLELPKMRIKLGQEAFRDRIFKETRDPYYPVMVGPLEQDYYWLNEAIVSWGGEKFVPEEDRSSYIPPSFAGNEMAPFNGMQKGIEMGIGDATTRARNHGYGMSAIIRELVKSEHSIGYDDSLTSRIHEGLGYKKLHPVKAVEYGNGYWDFELHPWFKGRWWIILNRYFLGEIYNVDSYKLFYEGNNFSGVHEFTEGSSRVKIFSGSYPNLSAKVYKIKLRDPTISDGDKAIFKLINTNLNADELRLLVYISSEHMGRFEKIGDGYLRKEINIKQWYTDLTVMVVNAHNEPPYTNTNNIDLEIKLEKKPEELELDVNRVHVMVKIGAHFKDSDDFVTTGNFKYQNIEEYAQKGTYENKTFKASWNETLWDGGTAEGSITLQFDTASTTGSLKITDYEIKNTEVRPWDTSGTYKVEKVFRGNNKKIYGYTNDLATVIEVYDLNVCSNRDFVKWDIVYPKSFLKLTNTFCNDESYFRIRLWKEE